MDSTFTIANVPFFTQRLAAKNLGSQGFDDHEDAVFWSKRICALACLQMVYSAFKDDKSVPTLGQLLDKGLSRGAYKRGVGWIHQGIADLAAEYGICARCESAGHDVEKIAKYIESGYLVMASVTPAFKGGQKYISADGTHRYHPRGGHLILLYGTTRARDSGKLVSLRVHHPHYQSDLEWEARDIPIETFLHSFSDRGNIIIFEKS